jgi:hypothetical protein
MPSSLARASARLLIFKSAHDLRASPTGFGTNCYDDMLMLATLESS